MAYYTYNDLASVERAAEEADGDVAAIIVSPFKHDAGFDQEMVDPDFALGLRQLCDRIGAVLVMDEVRAGFRLNDGGSWESIGVEPDLSAWSKAIGNGYPLAAVLGSESLSEAASRIFVTGSFWFQAVPMAAAVATITAIRDEGAVPAMERIGASLRAGIERQAHGRRAHRVSRPDRCRCPTSGSPTMSNSRAWLGRSAPQSWIMA